MNCSLRSCNSLQLKIYVFLFLLLLLSSACKEEKKLSNPLIGDWSLIVDSTRVEDWYRSPRPGKGKLYSFLNDSVVDTKTFYYKDWSERDSCIASKIFDSKTKYRVSGDTLLILNSAKNIWDTIGKIRLSKDSLRVFRSNKEFVYRRIFYPIKPEENFDQIIISSSVCFGTCPVFDVSFDSEGSIYFNGEAYLDNLGFYKSKLSLESFNEIKNNFVQADFSHLKDSYHADWTDDFTVSVTFVKGGEIIKSIEDYGEVSPPEFVYAYQRIEFLLQSINFQKIDSGLLFDFDSYYNLYFFNGKDNFRMNKSESFLLNFLLNKASTTTNDFDELYTLSFSRSSYHKLCDNDYSISEKNDKFLKITTDGRYYKFYFRNEKPLTLDIGHNFISKSKEFLD